MKITLTPADALRLLGTYNTAGLPYHLAQVSNGKAQHLQATFKVDSEAAGQTPEITLNADGTWSATAELVTPEDSSN